MILPSKNEIKKTLELFRNKEKLAKYNNENVTIEKIVFFKVRVRYTVTVNYSIVLDNQARGYFTEVLTYNMYDILPSPQDLKNQILKTLNSNCL